MLERAFEYVFGSKKYALYVTCYGLPVPMGLYDKFAPEAIKRDLLRREARKYREKKGA